MRRAAGLTPRSVRKQSPEARAVILLGPAAWEREPSVCSERVKVRV